MQEFQKEKVEPVSKMYDETRRVGQALIQSAAAGVSTTDIEFNLRTLNNVWTTLTDRVLCPAYLLTYSVQPRAGSGAVSKWVICACDSLVDFGAV